MVKSPAVAQEGKGIGRPEFVDKRFLETKEKLMNWNRECEKYMERLKERIENSNMSEEAKQRIQERIENVNKHLEEMRGRISIARNYEELRNTMMENAKDWRAISREMRAISYEHVIAKVESILEKLEELADRFEIAGFDVTKLRENLMRAKNKLNEIKSDPLNATREDFRELNSLIRASFDEVKKLSKEYKPAPKIGIVNAKVNGTFSLNGTMVALIKGNGTLEVNPEAAKSEAKKKDVVVVRGDVEVNGEGEFKIIAHGKGTLEMTGSGTYAYKRCANESFISGNFSESFRIEFGC